MLGDTSVFPFRVNKEIKGNIGVEGLWQLAANLWPADCQTCGQPLGEEIPALVVHDITVIAAASLHHTRCHAASWNEGLASGISSQHHLSYRTRSALLPTEVNGNPDPMPAALVNPSLEQAMLRKNPEWSVSTMSHFRDHCGLTGIDARQPVPEAYAQIHPGGILAVLLERTGQGWEFDINEPLGLREAILRRHGVALGVTTSYLPTEHFATVADFATAMQSGQMALGWVTLRS